MLIYMITNKISGNRYIGQTVQRLEKRWCQHCNLTPNHLVPQLARHGGGGKAYARTFSPWSHVVSLIYAQVTHSLGLNDVCDALRLRSGPLSAIRGATPPSKNGLSHANRQRNPQLAEQLFWKMLEHLQSLQLADFLGHNANAVQWQVWTALLV